MEPPPSANNQLLQHLLYKTNGFASWEESKSRCLRFKGRTAKDCYGQVHFKTSKNTILPLGQPSRGRCLPPGTWNLEFQLYVDVLILFFPKQRVELAEPIEGSSITLLKDRHVQIQIRNPLSEAQI